MLHMPNPMFGEHIILYMFHYILFIYSMIVDRLQTNLINMTKFSDIYEMVLK